MTTTVHAIFEKGVFRPVEPISLPESTSVELEVRMPGEQRTAIANVGRASQGVCHSGGAVRFRPLRYSGST